MLRRIFIANYALIEEVDIELLPGFSAITGQTGAGKSILLEALSLALGHRADLSALRDPAQKCIIDVQFDLTQVPMQSLFEQLDLDYETLTHIRREILPSGKSRAFVNDTPASLSALQQLAARLIDIHCQDDTTTFADPQQGLFWLDSWAGQTELLAQYQQARQQWLALHQQWQNAQAQMAQSLRDADYRQFIHQEITAFQPDQADPDLWEQQLHQFNHLDQLRDGGAQALQLLQAEGMGLLSQLQQLRQLSAKWVQYDPNMQDLHERVQSIWVEMADWGSELEQRAEQWQADPQVQARLTAQLEQWYQLQRKHQVANIEALRSLYADLSQQLDQTDQLADSLVLLEQQTHEAFTKAKTLAQALHQGRLRVIPEFTDQWLALMRPLGMPDVQLSAECKATDELLLTGMDQLQWYISVNKGLALAPLQKVASGGERSRMALALKALLCTKSAWPTLILDEIDTGVSGEMALRMAALMCTLGAHTQVLTITHLPQVAAKAQRQYKVRKWTEAHHTHTQIELLSEGDRINELAEMLSGAEPTESARAHARQLLL